jgi:DNA-binding NarL/FixJ family response regulator
VTFLAENHGMLGDVDAMERYSLLALAAAPDDAEIAGSIWGGRGVAALLVGDRIGAVRGLRRAVEILADLPNAGPAIYLGLWPLLLAVTADTEAKSAISAARAGGMSVNRANRGLLLMADAVIAGDHRSGRSDAEELLERGRADLVNYPVWSDLALLLAAEAALAHAWGDPRRWLATACEAFERQHLEQLLRHAHVLMAAPAPSRLTVMGVTARETEVLDLIRQGLSNRDIATRLILSPRTVEKHVETLLRKTGARSRTQLVAATADVVRPDP